MSSFRIKARTIILIDIDSGPSLGLHPSSFTVRLHHNTVLRSFDITYVIMKLSLSILHTKIHKVQP